MNKNKIYWTCQIAGWTAYTSLDQFIFGLKFGYGYSLIINAIVNILLGIFVTHSYRIIIKNLSWLDLPLARLVPRIVVSVTLMAVIMASINIPLDYYTIPGTRNLFSVFTVIIVIFYVINWFKHLLLWSLIYHLFQYFERSKKNEVEKIKLTSSIKDFEAKILRSQLNPHFMFNALNSIRALVLENPEKAQISVTRLSNLLRNSLLADRRRTVTLEEELKTVQDYLALEKIRYEDRLNVSMKIQPDTLPVQVPPMMVQTLVENAVKHGISKPLKGGFISIEAEIMADFLYLSIKNTGVLQQINSDGFGLVNTTQRLALIFGNLANFTIQQESEGVVCAQVVLPTSLVQETPKVQATRKSKQVVS